jgi:tetratricopeptide (TPR) repeat protein
MFPRLIVALLPTRVVLWWADRMRARGDPQRALAIADDRLRRLRRGHQRAGQLHYLRGNSFRDLRKNVRAAEAFLQGYEPTRADPKAFSFLVTEILRNTLDSRRVDVLIDYFGSVPAGDEPLRVAANERQFQKLLAPPANGTELQAWNERVRTRFPRWRWPRMHLAMIAASRGQWPAASRELKPIVATGGFASALLAYVNARQHLSDEAHRLLDSSPGPSMSRSVLLLQAHTHRILGNATAAAAFFDEARPLEGDDLLSHAESLIHAGRGEAAREVLERFRDRDDPRWLLLAASSAASGDDALRLLARCFGHEHWSVPAVTRALLILERDSSRARPADDKAILDAFTEAHADLEPAVTRVLVRHLHREMTRGPRAVRKALKLAEAAMAKLPSLGEHREVHVARACLLVTIDHDAADDTLRRLNPADPRVMRLAAARHAISGNHREALRLLGTENPSIHADALRYLCDEETSTAYYTAAKAARSGSFAEARQWLARVGNEPPFGEAARRLRTWIELQEAPRLAANGNHTAAARRVASAIHSGMSLGSLATQLLPCLIASGERQAAAVALRQVEPKPAQCHRRGIFHLCSAEIHASRSEWDQAVAEWESAIACFVIALSDSEYLENWIEERTNVYAGEIGDAETVRDSAIARLSYAIERWQTILAERDDDTAASIGRLGLALQAEVRAAALLRPVVRRAHLPVAIGPLGIRCFSLERPMAQFVASLRERRGNDVEPFERAFSDLRYASLLEDHGQLEAALDHLHAIGRVAPCNPAFEQNDRGRCLFQQASQKFESSLLIRLAEQEVSSSAARIAAGLGHWREVLELSRNGSRSATVAAIHEITIGRARTLDERSRYDEAICLLEGVNDLCGNDVIRGELASVHAHAAIEAVNEHDDWERGLQGLRKARELNRRSPFIDQNLVIALRQRSRLLLETDHQESAEHLQEALAIAEANLHVDRDNKEWQEAVQGIRGELMFRAFTGADVTRPRPKPPMVTTGLSSGRGSAHRERGMMHLTRGSYNEAAAEFQHALRLDPNDREAREQLAGTLMRMLSG